MSEFKAPTNNLVNPLARRHPIFYVYGVLVLIIHSDEKYYFKICLSGGRMSSHLKTFRHSSLMLMFNNSGTLRQKASKASYFIRLKTYQCLQSGTIDTFQSRPSFNSTQVIYLIAN